MRNIPMFATQYGVASLTLQDIPYRGEAYIKIQDTAQPKEFLDECVGFCRAAGADLIYASGHDCLEPYPFHTAIWKMTGSVLQLPQTDAALFPITEQTLEDWCRIYNEKMGSVPNASYMSRIEAVKLLQRGDGYFVHRGEELLGIGIAAGDQIAAIASVKSGAGAEVFSALCHALSCESVQLEVSSQNTPALRLYEKLKLVRTAEISRWFRVYPPATD